MNEPITVLIVDDHPMFRNGLRALLEAVDKVEVVGEASDGESAIALAVELLPDVVVMDVQMPGINGVEATRQIAIAAPTVRILVLTMFDDDDTVFAAMRAGAAGYLLKDAEHEDVLRSLMAVARGDAVFGPGVAARVRAFFTGREPARSPFPQLTQREIEVLDGIAGGANNQTIARRLGVTPKTIRNMSSSIFLKLQVADRSQAMIRARDAGLGRPG